MQPTPKPRKHRSNPDSMAVINVSSPHMKRPLSTAQVMQRVALATLPGLIALCYFFSSSVLINIVLAILFAIGCEALVLTLRKKPVGFFVKDYSAVVTAVLLALALPPTAPWWLMLVGIVFAIIVAKHLYGGLGSNPFNPAMVGYVVLLISFPVAMTSWLPPSGALLGVDAAVIDAAVDATTGATPLDTVRTYRGNPEALDSATILHGVLAGQGWEWVNIGFLIGGIYLIFAKVITWHIPVSFLLGLGIPALLGYGMDPDSYQSPLFHWLSGGAMLGAFFIATDPVSAATSNRGKLYYGAVIGLLIYIIRTWGGYPDAVAFAVLLANLCVPTIDYYTQPRTYGHKAARRGHASTQGDTHE